LIGVVGGVHGKVDEEGVCLILINKLRGLFYHQVREELAIVKHLFSVAPEIVFVGTTPEEEVRVVINASDMVSEYNALEVQAEHVPLSRYYLPRRSHQNPYKTHQQEERALYIGEPATYGSVLIEFLSYTSDKLNQSPRLPRPIANMLRKILAYAVKLLSRKQAIRYPQGSDKTIS